jgi:Putative peptidoglycan binding domain
MNARFAVIVLGFAVAALPAQARQVKVHKPVARAAHKTKPTQPASHTTSRKPPAKNVAGAPSVKAYAAMPESERLALQSDLAWAGDYGGPPGGDFDEHTVDAVKAFQKRNGGKETGLLDERERALLAAAAKTAQDAVGWQLIDDPASGARFGLPEKLVSPWGPSRTGSRWSSEQGQIQIESFRLREAGLSALFGQEKKQPRDRAVNRSVLKPDSFIITGTQGLKQFLVRAETKGGEVRGLTVLYDQAIAGTMDAVAIALSNGFEGFPDAVAGPGQQRDVEYGTAIIADARGDLITAAGLASGCEAIAVAGFGHAERVALDRDNDLALVRLHGARGLVAAPLRVGGPTDGALSLVGIADPSLQQGRDAVTTLPARLSGKNVEPAPTLGFSGAAAIDDRGRFAGMIELKSPPTAAIGASPPSSPNPQGAQAVLVPADSVRAFLASHGITPAADRATMNQSVLRIICVKK